MRAQARQPARRGFTASAQVLRRVTGIKTDRVLIRVPNPILAPVSVLDLRTLFVAAVSLAALAAGAFWLTHKRYPGTPGPGEWAGAHLLFAIASLLAALRGHIWDGISIVLANGTWVFAYGLLAYGLRRFRGLPTNATLQIMLPTTLTVAALLLLWLPQDLLNLRTVLMSVVLGGQQALILRDLNRSRPSVRTTTETVLNAVLLCSVVSHLGRILATPWDTAAPPFFGQGGLTSALMLWSMLLNCGLILCLLTLVTDRLQADLSRLAARDPLTHLLNRRAFRAEAEREISDAVRNQLPVTLMMLDLDHFKALNDRHGHQGGDEALLRLARILKSELRQHDLAARYGGEEFCVMLPGTGLEPAREVAERLRRACEEESRHTRGTTVSIGLTLLPHGPESLNRALKAADQALYEAKRSGRNRVEVHAEPMAAKPASHA